MVLLVYQPAWTGNLEQRQSVEVYTEPDSAASRWTQTNWNWKQPPRQTEANLMTGIIEPKHLTLVPTETMKTWGAGTWEVRRGGGAQGLLNTRRDFTCNSVNKSLEPELIMLEQWKDKPQCFGESYFLYFLWGVEAWTVIVFFTVVQSVFLIVKSNATLL